MAEILDIFGNYVRAQGWPGTEDPRQEVRRLYDSVLSPARCRELWLGLTERADLESADERDQAYCRECTRRIIQLQNHVDDRTTSLIAVN